MEGPGVFNRQWYGRKSFPCLTRGKSKPSAAHTRSGSLSHTHQRAAASPCLAVWVSSPACCFWVSLSGSALMRQVTVQVWATEPGGRASGRVSFAQTPPWKHRLASSGSCWHLLYLHLSYFMPKKFKKVLASWKTSWMEEKSIISLAEGKLSIFSPNFWSCWTEPGGSSSTSCCSAALLLWT